MAPERAPPSKVARHTDEDERRRVSPEADSSERSRRIARRPDEDTSGTNTPRSVSEAPPVVSDHEEDEIINVEEVIASHEQQAEKSHGGQVAVRDDDNDDVIRPRGGTTSGRNLVTKPENVFLTKVENTSKFRSVDIVANYIRVRAMSERHIYQYRVDFEPTIESRPLRKNLFREGTKEMFSKRPGFDGMHDFFSSQKLDDEITFMKVQNPIEKDVTVKLKITRVREVEWNSFDLMRVYNLHMKKFLNLLGFYQISSNGSWVHSDLSTQIGDGRDISMVRGFRTAAHTFDQGNILVNLEPTHKLMQSRNVLQVMTFIRNNHPTNLREALNEGLIGKLVITNYNKRVYRIEGVKFDARPTSKFKDKRDQSEISYIDYYKRRHNEIIRDTNQPLLQVVPNNKRSKNERGDESQTDEILLVPELCNITGLTNEQRTDNKLKMDMIRSSQISPNERIKQMQSFLEKFHSNVNVREALSEWGYSYDEQPVKFKSHVLPITRYGYQPDMKTFTPINAQTAEFSVNNIARIPKLDTLYIITTRIDLGKKGEILGNLKRGFEKVRLKPGVVKTIDINEGDAPSHYINTLRSLSGDATATVVIMHGQNKERYDSIKKIATVERGMITQVVTAKLMLDAKRVAGAATKIAIQVAAKIGGEPWWVDIPLKNAMICGYDTYRDTTKRGRSYGAFTASLNDKYSRWFSRADAYDQIQQVSAQLSECIIEAFKKYKEMNGNYPDRVFIYRDGVGEGQLALVYDTELVKVRDVVKKIDSKIRLTMIIVNKKIGARFYMQQSSGFSNPPPGTVVDHTVTRQGRYDFYLVSQSTRNGTVSPTYYNIIEDESNMQPEHHQMMAHKLCLMYYNWSGTVRVPAPCQYAHKLAAMCGEHLHSPPNEILSDRLHFL